MIDRPTVPEVAAWVREFYRIPGNEVGGSLHIVLDDGNVEDSSVEYCRTAAIERGDVEGERLAETLARTSIANVPCDSVSEFRTRKPEPMRDMRIRR